MILQVIPYDPLGDAVWCLGPSKEFILHLLCMIFPAAGWTASRWNWFLSLECNMILRVIQHDPLGDAVYMVR